MESDKCPRCGGTGLIPRPYAMRDVRQKAHLSLREIARRMKISAAYLSDLELGNRHWDAELIKKFHDALEA